MFEDIKGSSTGRIRFTRPELHEDKPRFVRRECIDPETHMVGKGCQGINCDFAAIEKRVLAFMSEDDKNKMMLMGIYGKV